MKIVKIKTIYNETFIAKCLNFDRIIKEKVVNTNKGYIPIEEIEEFAVIAE